MAAPPSETEGLWLKAAARLNRGLLPMSPSTKKDGLRSGDRHVGAVVASVLGVALLPCQVVRTRQSLDAHRPRAAAASSVACVITWLRFSSSMAAIRSGASVFTCKARFVI